MKLLLSKGAKVNPGHEFFFDTLKRVLLTSDEDFVNLLLSELDDINSWRLLCIPVSRGHVQMVNLLISKGANVNSAKNPSDGWAPLHCAARAGDVEMARLLVSKGADVNKIEDTKLQTPLHVAVHYDERDVASFLLANGADIYITDRQGQTPKDRVNSQEMARIFAAAADSTLTTGKASHFLNLNFISRHNFNLSFGVPA